MPRYQIFLAIYFLTLYLWANPEQTKTTKQKSACFRAKQHVFGVATVLKLH